MGAAASYAVKRPKWPTGRTAGFVFFGALAGRAIGSAIAVTSHYKFIGSIQEPEKFAKAMDNIQHRLGQPILRDVPIIMKPAPSSPSAASPDFVDSPDRVSSLSLCIHLHELNSLTAYAQPVHQDQDQPPARSNVASSPPPPISHQTQTSWDRIRRANANGAQQSSWDAIRQNHEKAEMQRRPPPQSQSTSDSPARDSRAEEQAKFDAMLEKERNFRSNT